MPFWQCFAQACPSARRRALLWATRGCSPRRESSF
jgi:hypothetical protein